MEKNKPFSTNKEEKKLCYLCHEYKSLCDSHILPEFVYRPTYDQKHTAIKIDIDNKRLGKTQKGFYEKLLCSKCEGKINKWETYFSRIWFNKEQSLRPKRPKDDLVIIEGVDYKKFKLFHLSLIWRAGISKRREFNAVRLGPHEEKIRRMLLEENPGEPMDYQFICWGLRDTKTMEFADKLVRAFESSRLKGHWVYTLIFGGVMWSYWVSSHFWDRQVPPGLSKDGKLVIAVQDWNKNPSIQELSKYVKKRFSKQKKKGK